MFIFTSHLLQDRAALPDIYSAGPLAAPPMPQRASFIPGPAPAIAFQSQVPPSPQPNRLTGLSQAEISRLDSERQAALQQEAERKKAEEERLAFAARREFYTQSLADLRVAQSKVSRTLVEAQQRAEMERSEADAMEAQYNAAYESFSKEHARVGPMLDALRAIEEEKSGLSAKAAALKTAVSQLENYDPEWETRERGECETLRKEITELTVKHETLQKATGAIAARRADLESSISGLQTAVQSAEKQVEGLEKEVRGLTAEVKGDGASVSALLRRVAPLYNELYAAAKQAMVPLPPEALSTMVRPPATSFKYDALRFGGVGVADWENFESEGYMVTAALPPDVRLKSLTSPGLDAAVEESENNAVADGDCPREDDGVDVDDSTAVEEETEVGNDGGEERKEEVTVEDEENPGAGAAIAEEVVENGQVDDCITAPEEEEINTASTTNDDVIDDAAGDEVGVDIVTEGGENGEVDGGEVAGPEHGGGGGGENESEKDPFGDVFGSVVAEEKARKKSGNVVSPTSTRC